MGTKTAAAPATTTDELEDVELDELEEADEAPAETEAPAKGAKAKKAKKAAAPKAEKPSFGTSELAAHVSKETGKTYDGKAIRVLLRKMAKDGVIARTVGEDRARYSFTGPDDPQVAAIVTAVKEGAAEKAKAESLEAAKASKKASKAKKAVEAADAVQEADDDDDAVEELED